MNHKCEKRTTNLDRPYVEDKDYVLRRVSNIPTFERHYLCIHCGEPIGMPRAPLRAVRNAPTPTQAPITDDGI